MPRVFVPAEQLLGDRVLLDRASSRHLTRVLRLQVGAEVVVFDGRGTEISARMVTLTTAGAELLLGPRRHVAAPAVEIVLLQSVPRGDRMDLIVQKTTELGVSRVVPVLAERGVVKPPPGRICRWQTIAQEAARQSGRADVPEIGKPVPLAAALAASSPAGPRLVLWEEERALSMRRALAEHAGFERITLLVGPEGGFSPAEIAAASSDGFRSVGLGRRVLRVETAALVAVTLAQAAAGALD
jgi:16S rRNA (uracil1498-N3)-methyltransferase